MATTKDRIWAAIHEKHGKDLVLGHTTTAPVFSIADAVDIAATVADMALASTISEHETVTAALLMRVEALKAALRPFAEIANKRGLHALPGTNEWCLARVADVETARAAIAATAEGG